MNIVMTPIADVKPYANNPRKNGKAIDVVADSLEQFGWQQPIVVDKDKIIIVGHTRYLAAKKLNLPQVPILIADTLTDEQTKQYRIMDNKSNEYAHWDDTLLLTELQSLLKDDNIQDLAYETGFTESELNKMFADNSVDDLDKYLNKDNPKSRTGDLWSLGEHKILNGSSTEPTDLATLMDKDMIAMVWEDPPYGITYRTIGGFRNSKELNDAKDHIIANDTLNKDQLDEFLMAHTKAMDQYVKPGAAIYWCHDIRFNEQFKQILMSNKYHVADTLIWKKNQTSNFLSNYWKFYEPIFYGWKEGAQHSFYGKGMNPNVIEPQTIEDMSKEELVALFKTIISDYQEVTKEPQKVARLHPTVKPVKLIILHLINSSKINDIIYDGFSGSGSTLLACEKTGRVARCIELESKFVDVTIARWQELTGLQAVRQDGVLWDDIDKPISDSAAMEEFFNLPVQAVEITE